jgi:hypothetical protein
MRRKWIFLVIVIFSFATAGIISYQFIFNGKTSAMKEMLTGTVSSASQEKTLIAPHMEQEIVKGKNIVYCSTIQLAWNEFKNVVVKEDIRMADEPPMVKVLNRGLATREDLSEKDYVAMAGFGRDNIVEKINRELTKKFKDEAKPVEGILPDRVMIYAFLYKNLEFQEGFFPDAISFYSDGLFFKVKSKVQAFGISECHNMECVNRRTEMEKQVEILYYPDDKEVTDIAKNKSTFWKRVCSVCPEITEHINFVIRLKTKTPDDEIILAKIKPENTIQKTIETAQELIKNRKPEAVSPIDRLSIPKIFLDIEHSYKPLLGKRLQNKGVTGFPIEKATQRILFKLNEKGATLKSSMEFVAAAIPKQLVFDRPFLIYLKEKKGKWPYFVMWVDNPELMENI